MTNQLKTQGKNFCFTIEARQVKNLFQDLRNKFLVFFIRFKKLAKKESLSGSFKRGKKSAKNGPKIYFEFLGKTIRGWEVKWQFPRLKQACQKTSK